MMSFSQKFQQWMQGKNGAVDGEWNDDYYPRRSLAPGRSSWLNSLTGHNLEMAEVEEEVAAEQTGQVALVGLRLDEAVHLLAQLRQQALIHPERSICREGFFTLVQLCAETAHADEESTPSTWSGPEWSPVDSVEETIDLLRSHDLILYMVRADVGWRHEDAHWFSRLRATGVPLLAIVMLEPHGSPLDTATVEGMRKLLGSRPVVIKQAADTETTAFALSEDLTNLIQRVLTVRPRLAIALAQEVPACRRMIADKVIRTGALMTTLLGSEPIPLLDLPLHVATQWKLTLQLSAIYGRPGLDYRSREMAGTVVLSLVVRHSAQQVLKLVPMVGWLLSGLLSGVSTWLLGKTLVRYYEEEEILPAPPKVSLGDLKVSLAIQVEHLRYSGPITRLAHLRQQMARRMTEQKRANQLDHEEVQTISIIDES
jgi:uncharacterized protein (DUF697 family)